MICETDHTAGAPLDSGNLFEVKSSDGGENVEFQLTTVGLFKNLPWANATVCLPREWVLNLAAWLVAIADPERKMFDRLLAAIKRS